MFPCVKYQLYEYNKRPHRLESFSWQGHCATLNVPDKHSCVSLCLHLSAEQRQWNYSNKNFILGGQPGWSLNLSWYKFVSRFTQRASGCSSKRGNGLLVQYWRKVVRGPAGLLGLHFEGIPALAQNYYLICQKQQRWCKALPRRVGAGDTNLIGIPLFWFQVCNSGSQ